MLCLSMLIVSLDESSVPTIYPYLSTKAMYIVGKDSPLLTFYKLALLSYETLLFI